MNGFIIRAMTEDDYSSAIDLWENTEGIGISDVDSPEAITNFLNYNANLNFIAEDSGIVIGTVLCGCDGRRGYIYHLAIERKYRNRGIGKALMEKVEISLKQRNIMKCHLFVFSDNVNAQNFYNETGWRKRTDLHVYSKNLNT